MSESTERLPPMDHKRSTSSAPTTAAGQSHGGGSRLSKGSGAELSPEKQPGFEEQEAARREAVDPGSASKGKKADGGSVELDAARGQARNHMLSLNDAMVDFALAHSDWVLDNLMVFLKASGGAGAVQFESVAVERLATNVLRSSVQAAGRTIGGLVQGAAAKAPATFGCGALAGVFGGLTGVIVSAIWGLVDAIFERARINKLVHGATSNLAAAVGGAIAESRAAREEQLGLWHTRRDGLLNTIDDARTLDELKLVLQSLPVMVASARQSAADLRKDKNLAKELLAAWIKQTAKDDEEGGKDVNPVSYARPSRTYGRRTLARWTSPTSTSNSAVTSGASSGSTPHRRSAHYRNSMVGTTAPSWYWPRRRENSGSLR